MLPVANHTSHRTTIALAATYPSAGTTDGPTSMRAQYAAQDGFIVQENTYSRVSICKYTYLDFVQARDNRANVLLIRVPYEIVLVCVDTLYLQALKYGLC